MFGISMIGTAENDEKSKLVKYSLVFHEIFGVAACPDDSAGIEVNGDGNRNRFGCV